MRRRPLLRMGHRRRTSRGIDEIVERCSDAAANLVDGIGSLPSAEVLSPAVTDQGLSVFGTPQAPITRLTALEDDSVT